ncbi:MFS transporter [Sandaracinobacteroides saxicola]|uniref:MFS transporter n=1 Tax=Sandaracinobacteroides saxicola TaxID=2759707 RepID=A0A7G5II74_9SPHN|nr:MFS transporter [Sandaracinobacteroides saxicola]QMW23066.1 MFS transporter [Sandaracinobacteroides saxicola]
MQAMVRAEDIPIRRRVVAFVFFMLADFFYGWAWNTESVFRPDIRAALGLTLTEAGLMYTAQGLGALVGGGLIIGQVADRIGRRNALFVVMVGYGLALLAGTYVVNFEQLMAQRFVLGLFLGGVFPTVVGLYTALFPRQVCGKLAGFYNGTFNGSVTVMGLIVASAFSSDYHLYLLMGAIPPLLLAPFAFLIVPDDRRVVAFGTDPAAPTVARGRLPIAELFGPGLSSQTLRLAAMVGLNFFGSASFINWQTTYMEEVRGIAGASSKAIFGWQFAAAIVGGFIWGAVSDRFGRRVNAWGFLAGAASVLLYLTVATTTATLALAGLAYGFFIAASVIWGPWLTELYPSHLRSTAASIFQWGRIVSFMAPPITTAVAAATSLGVAMGLAAVAFTLSALIWLSLPETLHREGR